MKNTGIKVLICMLAIATSSVVYAQAKRGQRGQKCNLSEEQQAQMKTVRVKYAEKTLTIKNELNELRARQHSLVSAVEPNQNEVFANVDKMTDLKKKLRLHNLNMHLEMNAFLDESQLIMKDARMNRGSRYHSGKGNRSSHRKGRMQGQNGKGSLNCGAGSKEGRFNYLDLDENQKEKLKDMHVAHLTDTKSLRDEAEEIRVKQKNLMTSKNPDEAVLKSNVNRLADIQNSLAKKRFDHQMKIREILDKDQLVLFLNHRGKRKTFHSKRGAF